MSFCESSLLSFDYLIAHNGGRGVLGTHIIKYHMPKPKNMFQYTGNSKTTNYNIWKGHRRLFKRQAQKKVTYIKKIRHEKRIQLERNFTKTKSVKVFLFRMLLSNKQRSSRQCCGSGSGIRDPDPGLGAF
jgi:hypothetical protein